MVRSVCALQPIPSPLMNSVLRGVLISHRKRCVPSVYGNLAAKVLSPSGLFIAGNRRKKEVDINHFLHISLAHAHLGALKATAQQHGIRLVGKLAP